MRERPILFSAPMVRALLAGTKTQTRRAVKPQPRLVTHPECDPFLWWKDEVLDSFRCPYGQPGDRLWVQEEHTVIRGGFHICTVRYEADGEVAKCELTDRELALFRARKYPFAQCRARFMYRSFSRRVLELTGVRVERLQAITREDALADGVFFCEYLEGYTADGGAGCFHVSDPRIAYAKLWEKLNGPGSWDANPWVWVLEFKRVEARS